MSSKTERVSLTMMVVQHPFSEFLVLFRLGIAANKVACRYASALHYLHYCYINYFLCLITSLQSD